MKKIILLFWGIQMISIQNHPGISFAQGGGVGTGGGSDSKPAEYESAWFLGAKNVIHICSEISPSFDQSKDKIESTFAAAFTTWKKYINEKKVFVGFNDIFLKEGIVPAQTIKFLSHCDGTEDLKLYMGVTNSEVSTAKKEFSNPVGFSHRSSYNLVTGWGKGFIWVSPPYEYDRKYRWPNWNVPDVLHGLFLHEIGDIFGCQHVMGTIMEENNPGLLQEVWWPDAPTPKGMFKHSERLTHIDNQKELFPCSGCDVTFENEFNLLNPYPPGPSTVSFFKITPETIFLVTGRNMTGKVHFTAHQNAWTINQPRTGELTFADELGPVSVKYTFKESDWDQWTRQGQSIFKVHMSPPDHTWHHAEWTGASSVVTTGQITTARGISLPIIIYRNMGGSLIGPYRMTVMIDGVENELFSAQQLQMSDPIWP